MKWYRIFLLLLLLAAVSGGFLYFYGVSRQNPIAVEGTLI